MSTPEQLLISALLIHKDFSVLLKENFVSDILVRLSPELLFLEKHGIPSISTFKSKFPGFKVLKVNLDDMPLLIKECKSNRIRLELARLIKKTSSSISNGTTDLTNLTYTLEEGARSIGMKYGSSKDVDILEDYETVLNEYRERKRKVDRGESIGIPFGFKTLDEIIGGMMPSDMITVAARMGNLKTWMLIYMAVSALIHDKRVLFISLEMSKDDMAYRVWTVLSRLIQSKKIRSKLILPNDSLVKGKTSERKLEILLRYFRDKINGSFHIPEIRGKFAIEHTAYKIEQHHPDVVFFDYFGLAVSSKGRIENWMEASSASNVCKELARTYEIPFVLASQVNRSGADRIPDLAQISITDSIGADSDRVFTLQKKSKDTLLMYCAKNRHGLDGFRVYYDIDLNRGKIRERMRILGTTEEDDE